ncbi:MAG: UDP-glucose--dolichyl-phosphate glucosyltransferase [Planctomycetota bacterium]|nr:MAG: UDP-glucose--dolichyl-phosphate glucosyltransferase [Planctomycetota bacterium]
MLKDTLLIIPCLNEEEGLPKVLAALPIESEGLRVVVVDNGSTDRSAERALEAGVELVRQDKRGYGAACLKGIEQLRDESVVAFCDGDYSDYPEQIAEVLAPIKAGDSDFVVASRMLLPESRRALLPQGRFGNWLAARLLRMFYGLRCSDLGPMRAIRRDCLERLGMRDQDYGWTVEMQAKAGRLGLSYSEVAARYRPRIGTSKVTGTIRGTIGASWKILFTLFRLRFSKAR